MEFNSLFFILAYLPVFTGLMYFIKNNNLRNVVLGLFSLLFYYFGDRNHLFLLLINIVVTYCFGRIVKGKFKTYLLYLLIVVGVLSYFKYGNYLMDSFREYFNNLDPFKIIMPLGISFYTFTSISYVSDVYYEKYEAETNPLYVLLYLTFFPVVISGPLIRYDSFKQFILTKEINTDNISSGIRRFIIGLAKKVIIANQLNIISSTIIADGVKTSLPLAWYAFIAYGVQEFYDFSGYSDMAIGIGKMIGYAVPENFNNPYFAHSVAEYWRKWHMSLGKWFNDYVFIPVSTSKALRELGKKFKKKSTGRTVSKIVSLLSVWFLTGIWHGSTMNYLIWGLLNGFIIILDATQSKNYKAILKKLHINSNSKWWKAFQILRTVLIIFSMKSFIFKCTSLQQVKTLAKGLIGLGSPFSMNYIQSLDVLYLSVFLFFGIVFLFPIVHAFFEKISEKNGYVYDFMLLVAAAASVYLIVCGSYSAFIYFSF